jgi:hypothetical protein
VSGRALIGLMYNGDGYLAERKSRDLEYVLPEEGATIFFDNMAIPKDAPHEDAALAFMNFVMEPGNQALTTERYGYSSVNRDSTEQLRRTRPTLIESAVVTPSLDQLEDAVISRALGDAGNARIVADPRSRVQIGVRARELRFGGPPVGRGSRAREPEPSAAEELGHGHQLGRQRRGQRVVSPEDEPAGVASGCRRGERGDRTSRHVDEPVARYRCPRVEDRPVLVLLLRRDGDLDHEQRRMRVPARVVVLDQRDIGLGLRGLAGGQGHLHAEQVEVRRETAHERLH